jgi:hypothetical protein
MHLISWTLRSGSEQYIRIVRKKFNSVRLNIFFLLCEMKKGSVLEYFKESAVKFSTQNKAFSAFVCVWLNSLV